MLVNPSDAGNIGTIIRTAVGFNITNILSNKEIIPIINLHLNIGISFLIKNSYI